MSASATISIAGLLLTLILAIIGAAWKLSATISKNTAAVETLTLRIDKLDMQNEKEHEDIWSEIEQGEATIRDHEKRLIRLEEDNK